MRRLSMRLPFDQSEFQFDSEAALFEDRQKTRAKGHKLKPGLTLG